MKVGDKVRFPVAGVFLANPVSVFPAVPGDSELEGTIIDFSDSGPKSRYFAVIEVVRTQSLIVPSIFAPLDTVAGRRLNLPPWRLAPALRMHFG